MGALNAYAFLVSAAPSKIELWRGLGHVFGESGCVLGSLGASWVCPWRALGVSWSVGGRLGGILKVSWSHFGRLGWVLGESWGAFGAPWGRLRSIFDRFVCFRLFLVFTKSSQLCWDFRFVFNGFCFRFVVVVVFGR